MEILQLCQTPEKVPQLQHTEPPFTTHVIRGITPRAHRAMSHVSLMHSGPARHTHVLLKVRWTIV